MLEDIELKELPQTSGVYYFINSENEIIYIGSSKNIYTKIQKYKNYIKTGNYPKGKEELCNYLKNNSFTIGFSVTESYEFVKRNLIELFQTKFIQL